jgi:hypothetical protein
MVHDKMLLIDKCNKILAYSYGRVMFFIVLAFIPFCLGIYILIQMIQSLSEYLKIKTDLMNKISMTKVDPLYRSDNDNEDYVDPNETVDNIIYDQNSYKNITGNIDGSFKDAQDYNKSVEKYWRTVHKSDPIDVIDRSSMLKDYDNW